VQLKPFHGYALDVDLATRLVQRYLDPALRVRSSRRLYGGSISRVLLWRTSGEPREVVAKLNHADHADTFRQEAGSLRWYAQHTRLPVPRPLAVVAEDDVFTGSGLLMSRLAGVTLSDARLSPQGITQFQHDLAEQVAALHACTRERYGSALDPGNGAVRWLDVYGPQIERDFAAVRDQLSTPTRSIIADLLAHLDVWLPEADRPTLVHGDLWATNILVDDSHPDRPVITGFIDAHASYCDPEYELAYLRVFHTVNEQFFGFYQRHHALREGFERRCRVYWLGTMLMHVRVFGGRYLPACNDLARQIQQLSHR